MLLETKGDKKRLTKRLLGVRAQSVRKNNIWCIFFCLLGVRATVLKRVTLSTYVK